MMYSIKHNSIYNDDQLIAEITKDGLLEFVSQDLEKFRLPVWNTLNKAGRIEKNVDGIDKAIYFEEIEEESLYEDTEKKSDIPEDTAAETENLQDLQVINTVRELMDIVEKMSGEKAPYMSQSLGDKTPEVWDYFKRNIDIINTIKAMYIVNVKLDKLYK